MSRITLAGSIPRSITAIDVPVSAEDLGALPPERARAATFAGFEGKVGQTLALPGPVDEPVAVLVGLGNRAEIVDDTYRNAAAAYVRAVSRHQSVACTLAEQAEDSLGALGAVVEGLGLASYRYTAQKSAPTPETLRKITVVAKGAGAKAAFERALAAVDAVCFTRDLINEPGGTLTPVAFAERAVERAKATGLKISVWDERRIARQRFGGLLAVNKGSTHPPRFVVIEYVPDSKPAGSIGLIGKGITFDSGGLSLKTGAGMMTMKIDMAGGAAVLGALSLLPAYGSRTAATAYIPLTDNMVNGDAQRPGDVFAARNGKTVEVLNTDAEGRLVLADALSWASEQKHDALVDIATLTGAVSAALGTSYAGLMGTDDSLLERVERAAGATGEKVWRLPLPAEYRSQLDSPVADLKNIAGGAYGGALIAGLFLKEFVRAGLPWAHIDLGMSAMSEADDGVIAKGGTGFGVRSLARMVTDWAN